jgi:hypothetical protein
VVDGKAARRGEDRFQKKPGRDGGAGMDEQIGTSLPAGQPAKQTAAISPTARLSIAHQAQTCNQRRSEWEDVALQEKRRRTTRICGLEKKSVAQFEGRVLLGSSEYASDCAKMRGWARGFAAINGPVPRE